MKLQQVANQFFASCGDFFYPPMCLLCQRSLGDVTEHFCGLCFASLLECVPEQRCERCSASVGPFLETAQGCVHCKTDPYRFNEVISLGTYIGTLREVCLKLKMSYGAPLAFYTTQLLCEMFGPELRQLEIDYIVPIPHHWTDRLLQSHLPPVTIAEQLSRFLKVPVERHILQKTKRTPKQGRLSPSARRQNLRNAFQAVSMTDLKGKKILLVDDVLTTGTTANRATQILKQAGAVNVHVAVIARGIGA